MRKLKFFIIFLIVTVFLSAQERYIAVFNTLRLGQAQKDYKLLARCLAPFDIVGLVEVMDLEGVEKLVETLEKETSKDWEYHISPYAVGSKSYKEYFAYIWKEEKGRFLKSRDFYPNRDGDFERAPYGADFKMGEFDFTFVLAHSIFGKNESKRRAEAFKMVKVYEYYQNLDEKENDIIIAGDFNLSANDEAFENLLNHKDELTYTLSPTIKTTIGKKGFSNSYDNMFISKIYTKEFQGESGVIDFTQNKFREMKGKISDHLPIFMVVKSGNDDD